jgi:ABC-type uncharacterized transport system permease subunit
MAALFYLSLGLYGVSSVAYLAFVLRRHERLASTARILLIAAWASHLAAIGSFCLRGLHPLRDTAGLLNLVAWLVVSGYLLARLRWRLSAAGAIIAPLAVSLLVGGRLTAHVLTGASGDDMASALGRVHLVLVALGVATFGLAAAVAVLYLLQESALRARRLGTLYRLTPPLATLDGVAARLTDVGFPIFTLAVASGVVWLMRLPRPLALRFEHLLALGIWVVFASLVIARRTIGVGGRRAAALTLGGFGFIGLVLAIYIVRRWVGG